MSRPASPKTLKTKKRRAPGAALREEVRAQLVELQKVQQVLDESSCPAVQEAANQLSGTIHRLTKRIDPTRPMVIGHLENALVEMLLHAHRTTGEAIWQGPAKLLYEQLTLVATWCFFRPTSIIEQHLYPLNGLATPLFDAETQADLKRRGARIMEVMELMPLDAKQKYERIGRSKLVEMGWPKSSIHLGRLLTWYRRSLKAYSQNGVLTVARGGSSNGAPWILHFRTREVLEAEWKQEQMRLKERRQRLLAP